MRQGECVASIGYENGLHPDTLWEHPKNAALKELRQDPNALMPGDMLHVPDIRIQLFERPTTAVHRFKRLAVPERLKVQVMFDGEPRANAACDLDIDGAITGRTTDGEGRIDVPIPPNARTARLHFHGDPDERVLILALGHLDPIEEISGVQGRLRTLGLYHGPLDGKLSPETVQAIQRFQSQAKLEPDGALSSETVAALRDAYGQG